MYLMHSEHDCVLGLAPVAWNLIGHGVAVEWPVHGAPDLPYSIAYLQKYQYR
jgi:hypothetical protein